jgi:hypothetical protein
MPARHEDHRTVHDTQLGANMQTPPRQMPLWRQRLLPANSIRVPTGPSVWTLSILTHAVSGADQLAYRNAFLDFALSRGLRVYFTPGTTYIVPVRDDDVAGTIQPALDHQPRAMTADERGAILGWLCTRPEVHFVHVPRRRSGSLVTASGQVSVALAPMGVNEVAANSDWTDEASPAAPRDVEDDHGL